MDSGVRRNDERERHMNGNDIISAARKQGRTALDEAAGKALLAHYGVTVPKTAVV